MNYVGVTEMAASALRGVGSSLSDSTSDSLSAIQSSANQLQETLSSVPTALASSLRSVVSSAAGTKEHSGHCTSKMHYYAGNSNVYFCMT